MNSTVAIDVGGTNFRVMVGDKVHSFSTRPIFAQAVSEIITAVELFEVTPTAIGICTPGHLDQEQGQIAESFHLPGWEKQPLVKRLEEAFGCPVGLLNDACAAAIGEALADPDAEDVMTFVWGTGLGIGVARWVDGVLEAGLPQNISMQEQLHELIGGTNLQQRFCDHPQKLTDAQWKQAFYDLIWTLQHFVADERITHCVLGGGVTVHQHKRFARFLADVPRGRVKPRLSQLKGTAGLRGAMHHASGLIR